MDLDALRAFLAVAVHGSVAGAARVLGIPRSTLNRRLEALQTHFDVPLLEVEAQGVRLTSAGTRLVDAGPSLLAAAHAVEAEVRTARAPMPPHLEIWVSQNLHTAVAATLAQAIRVLHDQVQLTIRVHVDPVIQLAVQGDIAIHMGTKVPEGPWTARVIKRTPMRLAASAAYLELAGTPSSTDDLRDHAIIHWLTPEHPEHALPLLDGEHLTVGADIATSNLQVVHDLIRNGAGIGLQPQVTLPGDVDVNAFQPVLADIVGCDLTVWLVAPPGMSSRPQWAALVDTLVQLAGAPGPWDGPGPLGIIR